MKRPDPSMGEFRAFVESDGPVPSELSREVKAEIARRLQPPLRPLFFKVAVVQLFVGALTLVVCPQLGVGATFVGHGLMHIFMKFGSLGCAAACGAFYLGTSLPLSVWLLTSDERRAVGKRRWAAVPVLAAFSLLLLMVFGPGEPAAVYALWFLGAWAAGDVGVRLSARPGMRAL